jgi:hypothetical protein
MHGHCLCGQVAFEINAQALRLYQCHCSLCRRQGGSTSNTASIVPTARFRWLRGTERISSWIKDSGFRSDFCATCGSPVPNPLRDLPYIWIPAGLLDTSGKFDIVAHLCVASKAGWDTSLAPATCHDALPSDLDAFIASLQPEAG